MVLTFRHFVAGPLQRLWSIRLNAVRRALRDDPDELDTWRYRIEERILAFLLARYGDDSELSQPAGPRHRRMAPSHADHSRCEVGRQPRSNRVIRAILERIAAANKDM